MVLSEAEVATANKSKENIQQNTSSKAHATPPQDSVSFDFSMNSAVQLSDPLRYGVIRWMGTLPNVSSHIAGLELVSFAYFYMFGFGQHVKVSKTHKYVDSRLYGQYMINPGG